MKMGRYVLVLVQRLNGHCRKRRFVFGGVQQQVHLIFVTPAGNVRPSRQQGPGQPAQAGSSARVKSRLSGL
jgi:hypothetical protein